MVAAAASTAERILELLAAEPRLSARLLGQRLSLSTPHGFCPGRPLAGVVTMERLAAASVAAAAGMVFRRCALPGRCHLRFRDGGTESAASFAA